MILFHIVFQKIFGEMIKTLMYFIIFHHVPFLYPDFGNVQIIILMANDFVFDYFGYGRILLLSTSLG